jgi:hypothetical protein
MAEFIAAEMESHLPVKPGSVLRSDRYQATAAARHQVLRSAAE